MTEKQEQQLDAQLQQHLQLLLFVGFKLDLQQLLRPALRFLRVHADALIDDAAEGVFSRRVLAAANGASGAELLSRACLQQPLGAGFGVGSMFDGVRFDERGRTGDVYFTATLLQDFYEYPEGAKVAVELSREGILRIATNRAYSKDAGREFFFGIVVAPESVLGGGRFSW